MRAQVIQMETDSLIPYMQASKERERNEAMAGEAKRAAHKEQSVTAEELLVQPSPQVRAGQNFENPLDFELPNANDNSSAREDNTRDASAREHSQVRLSIVEPRGPSHCLVCCAR